MKSTALKFLLRGAALALILSLTPGQASRESVEICRMVPHNDLSFPVNTGNRLVGQPLFNQIIDRVREVYEPVFRERGLRLVVERNWKDPDVNAYATITPGRRDARVYFAGGMARHPLNTPDGFLLVACHEIGHHLGGAPLMDTDRAFSAEGQSDYFSTSKCFRRMLKGVDNVAVVARMAVDPIARRTCVANFPNPDDAAICIRSLMGSRALSSLLAETGSFASRVSFATPDASLSEYTYTLHPNAQCRLDTMMAGALCRVDAFVDFDSRDVRAGSCDDWRNRTYGRRPHCWYNPADPVERGGQRPEQNPDDPYDRFKSALIKF